MAGGEICDEIPDAEEELAGRQFSKRDRRDGTWRDGGWGRDFDTPGVFGGDAD